MKLVELGSVIYRFTNKKQIAAYEALAFVPCKSLIFVDIDHLSQNFDRAV